MVGGPPITGSITFRNAGSLPLTVSTATPPGAPFTISGLPAPGATLAAGAEVTSTVTFAPTATGVFTDAVDLTTTGGDIEVPISGTATTAPHMVLSATSIPYGDVTIGGSRSLNLTVSNDGGGPLAITKSKPPSGGMFTATTGIAEGVSIPAGGSITGVVRFSPTATGPASGTWELTGTDGTGVHVVTFSGNGVAVPPPGPPPLGGWQLNGSASLSGSNLILTPNAANLAGSAFWPSSVATEGFRVTFDETINQGTGADGLTFTFANPVLGALPTSLGLPGGGLGYAGIPGVAVTFDTYQNGTDPSANFMGIANGRMSTTPSIWPPTPPSRPCATRPAGS